MHVAIIGAGLSGLACALELEKHGISPVIFEQRHWPGEPYEHCAAFLHLYKRPYDPLSILKKRLKLDIRPINIVKTVSHKSPREKVDITGKLGYFFLRGNNPLL